MTNCISCKQPHTDIDASKGAFDALEWHDHVVKVLGELLDDSDVAPNEQFNERLAGVMCVECIERVHTITAATIITPATIRQLDVPWSPALFQWSPVPVIDLREH